MPDSFAPAASSALPRQIGPVHAPMVFDHPLAAMGFAQDAALVAALDAYPRDLFDINLYDFDAEGQFTLRTGDASALSGAQLLEAIQAGRLWVNMRGVEQGWPQLWSAAMEAFDAIEAQVPGLRSARRIGNLILSSPQARVPFHFDAAGVLLFHLRGTKRMVVFPGDEAHLSVQSMERVVAKVTTEEVPYRTAFEANGQTYDLAPGQAITWPFYAPHRVDNLGTFCASLSIEFQTWDTRLLNGALYTNANLRHWGLHPPGVEAMGPVNRTARWLAGLALKRVGGLKNQLKNRKRDFVPDARAADGAGRLG